MVKSIDVLNRTESIFSRTKAFAVAFMALLAFSFAACDSQLSEAPKPAPEISSRGFTRVRFGIPECENRSSASERAIAAPSALTAADITRVILKGAYQGALTSIPEEYTSYSYEGTYEGLAAESKILADGLWKFDLSVLTGEDAKTSLAGISSVEKVISADSATINFVLSEPENVKGTMDIKINMASEKFSRIVFEISMAPRYLNPVDSKDFAPQESVVAPLSFSYSSSLAPGWYRLTVKCYATYPGAPVCVKSFYARISPARTTLIEATYSKSDLNTPYSITYNTGSGSFKTTASIVTEYNDHNIVVLPVKSDLRNTEYDFDGWYLSEDYAEPKIEKWNPGDYSGDIVLYAKWKEKKREFFVDAGGSDGDGISGSSSEPFETLAHALSEIFNDDGYDSTVPLENQPLYKIYIKSDLLKSDDALNLLSDESGNPLRLAIASSNPGTKRTISSGSGASGRYMKFNNENIDVSISDLVFRGADSSVKGGAVLLQKGSFKFSDCSFTDNSSGESGGALYITDVKQITLENCEFTGNESLDNGGAIYLSTASSAAADTYHLKIDGLVMKGNSAAADGDGIFVTSNTDMELCGAMDVTDELYFKRFNYVHITVSSAITGTDGSIRLKANYLTGGMSVGDVVLEGTETYVLTESDVAKFALSVAGSPLNYELALDSAGNKAVAIVNDPDALYVKSTGDDVTGDGSYGRPFLHLAKALNSFPEDGRKALNDDGSYKNTVYILDDYLVKGAIGTDIEIYANIEGAKTDGTNTVLTCNIEQRGEDGNTVSAFWISGGQKFKVKNVDFTSEIPTSSYSLIGLTGGAELTMEDCSISGIETSRDVSAIYCEGSKLTLRNTSITNNIATDDDGSGWAYAVYVKKAAAGTEGELCVDGTVVISGNKKSSTSDAANLYLGDGLETGQSYKPVKILGDIEGSEIHLAIVTDVGVITDGYTSSGNIVPPSEIFKSDGGYSVKLNETGEAYLKTTGGSVSVQLPDPSLSIVCSPVQDGKISVTLTKNGTAVTEGVTYTLELLYNSVPTGLTSDSKEIGIPSDPVAGGSYTLSVIICYGGAYYNAEFEI